MRADPPRDRVATESAAAARQRELFDARAHTGCSLPLGLGLLVMAALVLLFAYVIPKLVPTLLTDSVYARIPQRLADQALPWTIASVLVLTGGGLALFAASSRMGRGRRWSTPVSTYRYREERNWS